MAKGVIAQKQAKVRLYDAKIGKYFALGESMTDYMCGRIGPHSVGRKSVAQMFWEDRARKGVAVCQ